MDVKTIIGRTIFFLLIVGFIAAFTQVFGPENSLIGVMIIVAALMLLNRDMTAAPVSSFVCIIALNLSIGAVSYLSSLYILPGILLNFSLIFALVFFLSQDSRSSLEFPFLLGYALMMSMPASPDTIHIRLFALTAGSVFIVLLNLAVNYAKNKKMTCHSGILALIDSVSESIDKRRTGERTDSEIFRIKASAVHSQIYDRLKKKFYTSPKDRSVMNLAVSVERLGKHAVEEDISSEDLLDLKEALAAVRGCTAGTLSYAELHTRISDFTALHPHLPYEIISGLELVDYELSQLSGGDLKETLRYCMDLPKQFSFMVRLKEDLKPDTMAFSYALRLALLISIFEFAASYYDLIAARWLTFTAIAISVHYVDMDLSKAKARLRGVFAGIIIFSVLVFFVTDYTVLFLIMLFVNYCYTLAGDMRYDVKMAAVNVSVLLMVLLTIPEFDTGLEASLMRLGCIIAGTLAVIAVNRLVLPYHISTENIQLGRRLTDTAEQIIERMFRLKDNEVRDARDLLISDLTAEKMRINLFHAPDRDIEDFLYYESEIHSKCKFYRNVSSVMVENPSESLKASLSLISAEYSGIRSAYRHCDLDRSVFCEKSHNGETACSSELSETLMLRIKTDLTGNERKYAEGLCDIIHLSSQAGSSLKQYICRIESGHKITVNPYREYPQK